MRKTVDIRCMVKPKRIKLYKTEKTGKRKNDFQSVVDKYRSDFSGNADIVLREFIIGGNEKLEALLIYIREEINKNTLYSDVLKPLMMTKLLDKAESMDKDTVVKLISRACIFTGEIFIIKDYQESILRVFEGDVILAVSGLKSIFVINIAGGDKRSIEEPDVEKRVRGNREGFVEDIWVNVHMIRRFVKDPNLKVELLKVGKRSNTDIALVYIKDIADDRMVEEVKNRLGKIKTDALLASGIVEQYIEDNPWSPFPQAKGTEKPDRAAAGILEGRILIIITGTPYVLSVPALFEEFFQATEDYYEKPHVGIFARVLRTLAFIIATTITAVYIALVTYHPELVPSDLLLSLAAARKKVPFPPVVEAVAMEIIIEVLREAGIRLPTSVGQVVGIVGGIVLGDAAIRANLVSPPVIIVVTVSTVCNFIVPTYAMSLVLRLLRLFLILLSSIAGAFGIAVGWLFIIGHLSKLESFGVPYMSPYAPLRWSDMKDSIIKLPSFMLNQRPVSVPNKDSKRAVNNRREKNGKQK